MTTEPRPSHDYLAFGLRVRSALTLPELVPALEPGEPDVAILCGPVADGRAGKDNADETGAYVINIPGVARFKIESGRTIIVDAASGTPERNIRLYLLGSAFGALLHQRGLLPLHANAIEISGKAVLFMGASGEGKSTLAHWFSDHGFTVLADDVCVVRLAGDGHAYASHGQQRLRLWKEALVSSGRDPANYARSFAGREDIDKFDVPFESLERRDVDCELAGIYLLATARSYAVDRLSGLQAAEAVFAHTYRGFYVNEMGSQREHWQSAIALVQRVPIFQVNRPRDLSLMNEHGMQMIDHVRSALGKTP